MSEVKDAKNGDIVQFLYFNSPGIVWDDAFFIGLTRCRNKAVIQDSEGDIMTYNIDELRIKPNFDEVSG